jgi:hypothetical protein
VTPARARHLGRRPLLTAAALAAGVLPLTACEDVPLRASDGDPAGGPPTADPDEVLLEAAVRAEVGMVVLLRPLLRVGRPQARRLVQRTLEVHRAHLELIGGPGWQRSMTPGPGRPRQRWDQVVAAEERLGRHHSEAAVRASSGQFARVLAGMAAASAQQADLWRQSSGKRR